MSQVTLLAGGVSLPELSGALVWDRLDVPGAQRSVPAYTEAHMADLRAELVALVYDLGRAVVNGSEVQEHLKAGDALSMWWCSLLFEKHPKVTPALYSALKLRALERMLAEGRPWEELCLYGGDKTLAKALRAFCAAVGRKFSHVPAGQEAVRPEEEEPQGLRQKLRRMYYGLPGPAKVALRFAAWLWQSRALLLRRRQKRPAELCGTIATYFPNVDLQAAARGRFRSRYWEDLHTALASSGMGSEQCAEVNWLFIRFPSPQASFTQCLAMQDRFRREKRDGRTFHYLEEFIGFTAMRRAFKRYGRLAVVSRVLEHQVRPLFQMQDSQMNLWPYLGQYWEDSFRGWRCLERCLHREGMVNYVRWAGPQRWTIFPMENCPWERMLTEAVHAAGHGPVYGTQHSTVRGTDFRYFDDARTFATEDCQRFQPDRLLGNGQGACAEMLAAGTPPERLGVVEALRYMYLAGRLDKYPQLPPVPGTRLLVVTSFFADEVQAHIRVLARWMRQQSGGLAALADGAAPWEVVIKPHPYLAVEPYLREHFPEGNAPPVLDAPIDKLLTPGTTVWASNSTTVALEAALMGLPVLVQRPEDDIDLCPLQNVPGVARIATAQDVSAALALPTKAQLPPDYLALDPALPLWRRLLDIA